VPIGDAVPVHKDLVIATLGAAAALAGLILVFIGILITGFVGHVRDRLLISLKTARPEWQWVSLSSETAEASWVEAPRVMD
jgi:hypothetical protein